MNLLSFLLPNRERPDRVFRLKIKASCTGKGWSDNQPRTLEAGEIIDATEDTAFALIDSQKAENLGLVDPNGSPVKKKRVVVEIPPAALSQPMPEDWADLPKEFPEVWKLTATREALVTNIATALTAERTHTDPSKIGAHDILHDHVMDCRQALKDWDKGNGDKITKALCAVNRVTIEAMDNLNAFNDELREIVFKIFSLRVAALELPEFQVRGLFARSGLAHRYGVRQGPMTPCSCFIGPNGQPCFDDSLITIASYFRLARERKAELEKSAKLARADLEKAQKACGTIEVSAA